MVDDEEIDRLLFTRLAQAANLSQPTRLFSRGDDIIDALIDVLRGAVPPLVCFLDVKMPGMNGFDVLRWIRCQRSFDEVPVVMLSSSEEPRDLAEALHFGAQCYISKFPPADHLRAIISEAESIAGAPSVTRFRVPGNLLATLAPA